MNKVETPFGWKRNLNFIKVNLFLMWRRFVEYKLSLYSSLTIQILFVMSQFFFLFILSQNFGSTIGWTFKDFAVFTISFDLAWCLVGLIGWTSSSFSEMALSGDFNKYFSKPISVFIQMYFTGISSEAFLYVLSDILILFILVIYFQINVSLFLLLFLFFLLLTLFLLRAFIDGFGVWKYKFDNFLNQILFSQNWTFQQYPGLFYKEFRYKFLLLIFPLYFFGLIFASVLKGQVTITMFEYFLIFGLVFSFLSILVWKKALKNYEAFG